MVHPIKNLTTVSLLALLLLGLTQSVSAATVWQASYYDNRTLAGSPVMIRTESGINHNWGGGSPASFIPVDNFSARWERTENFEAGRYRFTVAADDGVRVYVDGRLIIDRWIDSSATPLSAEMELNAGSHTVRVDYYEHGGQASIVFDWQRISGGVWQASYWNNTSQVGLPILQRSENSVNYNWGAGSPASSVNRDFFSARWTTSSFVGSGKYRVEVTADDGVRVRINSNTVIDKWVVSASKKHSADIDLTQGTYTFTIDYFESQGDANITYNFYRIGDIAPVGGGGGNGGEDQTPYPALTLPADLSGNLRKNGQCLNSNWYVGLMEAQCKKSGKWTFYRHANGRYLIQSAESGKCLQRTQYDNGFQLRMHKCDRNNGNQHFNYKLDGTTIRIWLVDQNQRHIGIGGHNGDRAHLVNQVFSWNFVK